MRKEPVAPKFKEPYHLPDLEKAAAYREHVENLKVFLPLLVDYDKYLTATVDTLRDESGKLDIEKLFAFADTYAEFLRLLNRNEIEAKIREIERLIRVYSATAEKLEEEIKEAERVAKLYPVHIHTQPDAGSYTDYYIRLMDDLEGWDIVDSIAYSFDGEDPLTGEYSYLEAVKGDHKVYYRNSVLLASSVDAGEDFLQVSDFCWDAYL